MNQQSANKCNSFKLAQELLCGENVSTWSECNQYLQFVWIYSGQANREQVE